MEKVMRLLEFDQVIKQLLAFSLTVPGKQKAASLTPSFQLDKVQALQQETSEAVTVILEDLMEFPPSPDLEKPLRHAAKGGTLNAAELVAIRSFLLITESLQPTFLKKDRIAQKAPSLCRLVGQILLLSCVVSRINRCLDQRGDFRDDASPLLFSMRQEEKGLQEKIRDNLETYRRNPSYRKYLQENIITIRQNRYVLPVKQQFSRHIPGIIHDQSASGQTLFIEPFPITQLNNQLLATRAQMEKEMERILRELSSLVRENHDRVFNNYRLYGEIDLILARGKLSLLHEGNAPQLNEQGKIYIRGGRHPLLAGGDAVPVDLFLGETFNTLIITGPNTGGKTVTLKMVGLFVLMAQCGLHLPARPGSEISLFKDLWADIGDEQNISQSLSTFSGHMRNIIDIVKNASAHSLVLLDELGAGTDPSEGSALAMAVLDELHRRDVRTVATTHINELKIFAHLRAGMENASMEFDTETLQPTFRLLIGVPGKSNAISVASKLGMPAPVLEKACSYISRDLLNLDEAVSDLLAEKQKLTLETQKVGEMKEELAGRLEEVTQQLAVLEQRKKELLLRAREESHEMIRTTKQKASEIIRKLYAAEREENRHQGIVMAEEARRQVQDLVQMSGAAPPARQNGGAKEIENVCMEQITVGQVVYVRSLGSFGEVKRVVSKDEIQVGVGTLKVWTGIDDLGRDTQGHKRDKNSGVKKEKRTDQAILWEKTAGVLPHLDLRGLTLEEAIIKVEKKLDDSILAGLDQLMIIHGKGSGRLRRGLQIYLEKKNLVKSFRPGVEGEGGSGVTVVELST